MKKIAGIGFTTSLCLYILLHYVSYFYPNDFLLLILSIMGTLLIFFSLFTLQGKTLLLPLFLILLAILVQLFSGADFLSLILEGTRLMRSLIVVLLVVPIVGWILKEEPYIERMMLFFHRILNTSRKFYFGIMIINQIISYFLLFGVIPMMYQFIDEFLKGKKESMWDNYKSTVLLSSFSLTTMWVISIPSFAFAVDHLRAPLGWTILQGFFISLLGIILAVIFLHFKGYKYNLSITMGIKTEIEKIVLNTHVHEKWDRKVIEFFFIFISLFGTILTLHITLDVDLLFIIPPIIFIWTIIYYVLKNKKRSLLVNGKYYFSKDLSSKSQQYILLLSAGILIYSVNNSGLGNYIVQSMFYINNQVPFLNLLFILPFVVIFLGFIGLGPLTVIVLVTGILENVSLPYPPELVVLSITSGSVISALLSPFILPVIVLSASNGISVLKNGFRFNYGYAIAFYLIVQCYMQLMIYFVY